MTTKRETARRDARTAGKTVRQKGSAKRAWTNRRDRAGNPYAIDPDGRKWHGTPAEVREAALMPWRWDMWETQIYALLDVAQSDTGKREIPLTRHERAALDRLAAHAKVEG